MCIYYCKGSNARPFIDHFVISENLQDDFLSYDEIDSQDNFSDHVVVKCDKTFSTFSKWLLERFVDNIKIWLHFPFGFNTIGQDSSALRLKYFVNNYISDF